MSQPTLREASEQFNALYAGKVPHLIRSSVRYGKNSKEGKLYVHFDTDKLQDLWHAFQAIPQVKWYGYQIHVIVPNPPSRAIIELNKIKLKKSN